MPNTLVRLSLQLAALVSMLVDHVGSIFYPGEEWMRLIGRAAFPLFAYLVGQSTGRTRNPDRYLFRLLCLAVVAEVPHMWALESSKLNAIFTLWVGARMALGLRGTEWLKGRGSDRLNPFAWYEWSGMVALACLSEYGLIGALAACGASLLPGFTGGLALPAWVWRGFYASHFVVLALIRDLSLRHGVGAS